MSFEGSRGWENPACPLRPRASNIEVLPTDLAAPISGPDLASAGEPVARAQPLARPLLEDDASAGGGATPSRPQGPGTPDEAPGETSEGTAPPMWGRVSEPSPRPGQPREQETKRQATCGRTRNAIVWVGKRASAEPPKEGSCDQVAGAAGGDADGRIPVPAKRTEPAGANESGEGSLKLKRCSLVPKRFLKGGSTAAALGRRCLKVEVVPAKSAGYVLNLMHKTGPCPKHECGRSAEMQKTCRYHHGEKDRRTYRENLLRIGLKGQPAMQAKKALSFIFREMAGGEGEVAQRKAVEEIWLEEEGHKVASHTVWVLFSDKAACESALRQEEALRRAGAPGRCAQRLPTLES